MYGLIAGLAAATPGIAQESAPTADMVRKALESRRQELQSAQDREQTIKTDVAAIETERQQLNQRLLDTAGKVQESEGRLTSIEGRLAELAAQEKMLRGSLDQRYSEIAKLLAALQRMGRNPPPVMVTKREDALKMVRSAMLLAAAFPDMRTKALALAEKLNDLVRVMTDARAESDKLKEENTRLNDTRTELAGLMETKKRRLREREDELSKVRSEAAEISRSVTNLNELIGKFDEAVRKNTGLAAYDEEARRQVAAAEAAPAGGGAPVVVAPAAGPGAAEQQTPNPAGPTDVALLTPTPAPTAPSVVELAPSGPSILRGNAGRLKPAIAFHLAQGKLPMPAQGTRILSFGDKTQFGGTSKGIVVETRSGAQVIAPCDGWVVYAGEFRSYGQLLIINAGGGYHMLVAGLSQIDVEPGQFVLTAEPIGTMGGVTRTDDKSGSSAPVLYIEVRKDGQPIDPQPWWHASQEKVQG